MPIRQMSQTTSNPLDISQDNLLDLGDDRTDYRPTTISKHHQRYWMKCFFCIHLLLIAIFCLEKNMWWVPIRFQRDLFSGEPMKKKAFLFFCSFSSEQNNKKQQCIDSHVLFVFSHAGAGIPPTLVTPSLPEESQTTDDLLDRIWFIFDLFLLLFLFMSDHHVLHFNIDIFSMTMSNIPSQSILRFCKLVRFDFVH